MRDLFAAEQSVLDDAVKHLAAARDGQLISDADYEKIIRGFDKILKQMRQITRISDRTTVDLHASKLDLLDKVDYDPLTQLYNRRYIDTRLDQLIRSLSRSEGVLGMLMIDIDCFKQYNDTYGHSRGDDCLKKIAHVLRACISRADDFAARFGGEEFLVVLPNTEQDGACLIAEKIRQNIELLHMSNENTVTDCVTVSVGVTVGKVLYGQTGLEFVRRADEALYISKKQGKNRYTYLEFDHANSTEAAHDSQLT